MAQERRDVLEQDARLGEIGDVADVVAKVDRRGPPGMDQELPMWREAATRRFAGACMVALRQAGVRNTNTTIGEGAAQSLE